MRKKNNVFVLLLLCFTITLTLSNCAEANPKKEENPEKEYKTPTKPPTANIISDKDAKRMYKRYTKRRVPMIRHYEDSILKKHKKKDTFDIARYVEWDFETIKKYIAYIEEEAKKSKVELSTLRVYFGNNPNKKKFRNGQEVKHPHQNTVFFAPTAKKGNRNALFYLVHDNDGPKKTIFLEDDLSVSQKLNGLGNVDSSEKNNTASLLPSFKSTTKKRPKMFLDTTFLNLNRGGSSPPPYN